MQKLDVSEFPRLSHQQWQEIILKDLRGKELESLDKITEDGIRIRPDYAADNRPEGWEKVSQIVKSAYTRDQWFINQEIKWTDETGGNKKIREVLNSGVDSITISAKNGKVDFESLFATILPQYIEVRFQNSTLSVIRSYYKWAKNQGFDTTLFEGSFGISYFSVSQPEERIEMAEYVLSQFPKMRLCTVYGDEFFNSGATNVQQIAFSLNQAVEIMDELIAHSIDPQKAAQLIDFSFATGSEFFTEIAKFRAFRMLWTIILKEYSVQDVHAHVHGMTAKWTLTEKDVYTNLLRSTTQGLSAVIGGCQTITVVPFDLKKTHGTAFSERMARNAQLIIRDEAFAGKVQDIASGSYFIENHTMKLAKKMWELFLETEKSGGFSTNWTSGTIPNQIEVSRNNAWNAIREGKKTLLGVNKFPNPSDDSIPSKNNSFLTLEDAIKSK
jgi:methylmalonyl-CoA mutase